MSIDSLKLRFDVRAMVIFEKEQGCSVKQTFSDGSDHMSTMVNLIYATAKSGGSNITKEEILNFDVKRFSEIVSLLGQEMSKAMLNNELPTGSFEFNKIRR